MSLVDEQPPCGLCFSVFDNQYGPKCVYYEGIADDMAKKSAVKAITSSWSNEQRIGNNSNVNTSMVPLVDEDQVLFSAFFYIPDSRVPEGNRLASLSLMVSSNYQSALFELGPVLTEQAEIIAAVIKQSYIYGEPLTKEIKTILSSFKNFNTPSKKISQEDDSMAVYAGVVSSEEALVREKSAFILDKAILRAICTEGPISISELRKRTLNLEAPLGIRIDIPMIQEICDKYIKHGLIRKMQ